MGTIIYERFWPDDGAISEGDRQSYYNLNVNLRVAPEEKIRRFPKYVGSKDSSSSDH